MSMTSVAAQPLPASRTIGPALARATLLLLGGLLVFMPYALHARTPTEWRLPLWSGIALGLLGASLGARRLGIDRSAELAIWALFVASAAQLADWFLSGWLPDPLGATSGSAAHAALSKLESSLVVVAVVVALVGLRGGDLGSLYIRRGRVRWWLPIGAAGFGLFAASALIAAEGLFGGQALSAARIAPWIPWVLVFVFANGVLEELLFRGLLLPRFAACLGAVPAIVVTSLVFGMAHLQVDYTSALPLFLAITFGLGLLWATLVHKTDSLWGAVLFHAGADVPVIVGILSTMA